MNNVDAAFLKLSHRWSSWSHLFALLAEEQLK
jgi:hypothetical protein